MGEDGANNDKNDNTDSNSGVRTPIDNDNDIINGDDNDDNNNDDNNGTALVEAGVNVPYNELASDFGDAPYWNNGTIATNGESYMLSYCNV